MQGKADIFKRSSPGSLCCLALDYFPRSFWGQRNFLRYLRPLLVLFEPCLQMRVKAPDWVACETKSFSIDKPSDVHQREVVAQNILRPSERAVQIREGCMKFSSCLFDNVIYYSLAIVSTPKFDLSFFVLILHAAYCSSASFKIVS